MLVCILVGSNVSGLLVVLDANGSFVANVFVFVPFLLLLTDTMTDIKLPAGRVRILNTSQM